MQKNYMSFSHFYNELWSEPFANKVIGPLARLINQYGIQLEDTQILNVGSGAGHLDALLIKRGARVVGIDASERMVRLAKTNAPGGNYHVWRFGESIPTTHTYGVAISLYDSLNYASDLEELQHVFSSIHDRLAEEGVFVFDVNNSIGHEARWRNQFTVRVDGGIAKLIFEYDKETGIARMKSEGTLNDRSFTEVHTQMSIEKDCVERLTASAGFVRVDAINPEDVGLPTEIGRDWYVALKASAPRKIP